MVVFLKEMKAMKDIVGSRAELSCAGQHFVANQMQPDALWRLRLVKVETAHGLLNILPQHLPGVPLDEDVLREAFGAETAVCLLRYFKHQFAHGG